MFGMMAPNLLASKFWTSRRVLWLWLTTMSEATWVQMAKRLNGRMETAGRGPRWNNIKVNSHLPHQPARLHTNLKLNQPTMLGSKNTMQTKRLCWKPLSSVMQDLCKKFWNWGALLTYLWNQSLCGEKWGGHQKAIANKCLFHCWWQRYSSNGQRQDLSSCVWITTKKQQIAPLAGCQNMHREESKRECNLRASPSFVEGNGRDAVVWGPYSNSHPAWFIWNRNMQAGPFPRLDGGTVQEKCRSRVALLLNLLVYLVWFVCAVEIQGGNDMLWHDNELPRSGAPILREIASVPNDHEWYTWAGCEW